MTAVSRDIVMKPLLEVRRILLNGVRLTPLNLKKKEQEKTNLSILIIS